MYLLGKIEKYLSATGMTPTRFGRDALNDPRFVLDLRRGREPRRRTLSRVLTYLEQHGALLRREKRDAPFILSHHNVSI
ncbi:MAG: hypothetical protein ABF461_08390 [Zymomonas mobilis subsp. pomaceae]|uniref:Uncharacterized protein n=1 Tax=Zymomonas mobilis subsp. pomaceae (strain ATCC 29192 / DSM 22645 / JCM 10191 / CCUG 17912 / NBRC 13757 / NCIMB 11200 / NRRL B-4491 / Barker I) TaxID=579138 RepID=F8EUT3_ZYMMT|nr:hypothetical protein [Zymomonas mobilis]AEI38229.1 hypothetical protein Zymop_1339 [Zymomonas mobilis subsp. pomaceae ATCC 29192]MDX5947919.1 hypothetical protein [Zymomonas mobilis subsp. pomaceae]GEB89980.1 hypothetical protein ZMO02_16170 [Zymomonas mobilis subsp. pomaceae]